MITATNDGSGGVRLHDDAGAFARVKPADRHRLRRALAGDGCTRAVLMPSGVITVTERHGSEVKLLTRDGKLRTGEGSDRTAIAARDYLLTEVERLLTWIEDDARLSSGDSMHLTAIVSEWRAPLLAGYDLGDRELSHTEHRPPPPSAAPSPRVGRGGSARPAFARVPHRSAPFGYAAVEKPVKRKSEKSEKRP